MSTFNLNGLKTQIQTILENNNTTTAATTTATALSGNLNKKVQFISKFNPDLVFTQVSKFPSLHIFLDNKEISQDGIAVNQQNARRNGLVRVNIMGVYQSYNNTSLDEDRGQENLEQLMENTEDILRSYPNLDNFAGVQWNMPNNTQYGISQSPLDEGVYFRVSILEVDVKVKY
ncbi:MAG: hypothetical protein HKM92_08595 [Arenibacter sp.]|nr:hypothetical protein [Arenibacter sp.]